jgi:hypothetical protein
LPYIDSNIQDPSRDNTDELSLGRGRQLKMQTTHGAGPLSQRLILLDEPASDAEFLQSPLVEDFAKPAAIVYVPLRNNF